MVTFRHRCFAPDHYQFILSS